MDGQGLCYRHNWIEMVVLNTVCPIIQG